MEVLADTLSVWVASDAKRELRHVVHGAILLMKDRRSIDECLECVRMLFNMIKPICNNISQLSAQSQSFRSLDGARLFIRTLQINIKSFVHSPDEFKKRARAVANSIMELGDTGLSMQQRGGSKILFSRLVSDTYLNYGVSEEAIFLLDRRFRLVNLLSERGFSEEKLIEMLHSVDSKLDAFFDMVQVEKCSGVDLVCEYFDPEFDLPDCKFGNMILDLEADVGPWDLCCLKHASKKKKKKKKKNRENISVSKDDIEAFLINSRSSISMDHIFLFGNVPEFQEIHLGRKSMADLHKPNEFLIQLIHERHQFWSRFAKQLTDLPLSIDIEALDEEWMSLLTCHHLEVESICLEENVFCQRRPAHSFVGAENGTFVCGVCATSDQQVEIQGAFTPCEHPRHTVTPFVENLSEQCVQVQHFYQEDHFQKVSSTVVEKQMDDHDALLRWYQNLAIFHVYLLNIREMERMLGIISHVHGMIDDANSHKTHVKQINYDSFVTDLDRFLKYGFSTELVAETRHCVGLQQTCLNLPSNLNIVEEMQFKAMQASQDVKNRREFKVKSEKLFQKCASSLQQKCEDILVACRIRYIDELDTFEDLVQTLPIPEKQTIAWRQETDQVEVDLNEGDLTELIATVAALMQHTRSYAPLPNDNKAAQQVQALTLLLSQALKHRRFNQLVAELLPENMKVFLMRAFTDTLCPSLDNLISLRNHVTGLMKETSLQLEDVKLHVGLACGRFKSWLNLRFQLVQSIVGKVIVQRAEQQQAIEFLIADTKISDKKKTKTSKKKLKKKKSVPALVDIAEKEIVVNKVVVSEMVQVILDDDNSEWTVVAAKKKEPIIKRPTNDKNTIGLSTRAKKQSPVSPVENGRPIILPQKHFSSDANRIVGNKPQDKIIPSGAIMSPDENGSSILLPEKGTSSDANMIVENELQEKNPSSEANRIMVNGSQEKDFSVDANNILPDENECSIKLPKKVLSTEANTILENESQEKDFAFDATIIFPDENECSMLPEDEIMAVENEPQEEDFSVDACNIFPGKIHFMHHPMMVLPPPPVGRICRFFQDGSCRYGPSCRDRHVSALQLHDEIMSWAHFHNFS